MTSSVRNKLLVVAVAGAVVATAFGIVGAAPDTGANDCLIGLEDAHGVQTSITCTDGDPSCDADGASNGSCTFSIKACVNVPGVSGCSAHSIKKAKVTPPSLGITVTPNGSSSACGSFTNVVVKLKKKGKKPGKKAIKANAISADKPPARDRDKLSLTCNPCTSGNCGGGGTTTTTIPGGGGPTCDPNPQGGPNLLTLTVGDTGNDLDTGFSGQSHNFLNVSGSTLKYCLTGCDTSSNPVCNASGSTGAGNTLNGPTFGPPLPLFSANVAVCVVNRLQDPTIQGTLHLDTGEFEAMANGSPTPLRLLSDTYQGTSTQVCPTCVNGKCQGGRNAGGNCTIDGSVTVNQPPNVNNVKYNVSKSCLPLQSNLLGTPNVVLPLTTETSTLAGNAAGSFPCPGQTKHDGCGAGTCTVDCSGKADPKGGINQPCCSTGIGLPCFPTDPAKAAGSLSRTGTRENLTPAWPDGTYPKNGAGTLAATFCISATGSNTVDATAGLPGPGAVLISGTSTVSK